MEKGLGWGVEEIVYNGTRVPEMAVNFDSFPILSHCVGSGILERN